MSVAELEHLSSTRFGLLATDDHDPCRCQQSRPEVVRDPDVAGDVAALFTAVRPCNGVGAALARGRAPELDPRSSPTAWILWEGLKPLDPLGRQRILDGWRTHRHDRAGAQVADGGCEVSIGGVPVTGELRLALLQWLPLARGELAVYEGGLFRDVPARALTLLVRPPTIWPAGDVVAADRLFPGGPRFEPARFQALERHASGQVRSAHLARLRAAVARIERQLPVAGFPVASSTVAAGCAVLAADDEWCAAIAATQLARYAASERSAWKVQAGIPNSVTHATVCTC